MSRNRRVRIAPDQLRLVSSAALPRTWHLAAQLEGYELLAPHTFDECAATLQPGDVIRARTPDSGQDIALCVQSASPAGVTVEFAPRPAPTQAETVFDPLGPYHRWRDP